VARFLLPGTDDCDSVSRQERSINNENAGENAAGKRMQWIGEAKAACGELTDNELSQVEGRTDRLAGLIQERCGKTRDDAELEVRRWIEAHRPR
jgi:uncharacterized protein YjbJ (UPF0337 family)